MNSLEAPRVYCFGRCFEAPTVGLSGHRPRVEIHSTEGVILPRLVNGGARTLDSYRATGGYRALDRALESSPEATLEVVDRSGLRGRGGAGFPTGKKWRAAVREANTPKYLVANADEGDAGAYVDRFLLEDDPHVLIEGMLLCAHAIGAAHGWIYLRHEYPAAQLVLERALAEARDAGLLGKRILGHALDFDLELVVGHGSYVCGEESALLRSISGLRPEPMARPPYITQSGLFGQPTVMNNVETFANIPWIVTHGADSYRALGFSESHGTKVVSLNSLFAKPGLYEVDFGVSVRHIVEELGGGLRTGALKGVLIGGPLSGIIPPHLLDTPFGFEELAAIGASVGHGGVVAFDEHTSITALIHHIFSFGAYESCGKCTPCRLGSRRVEEIFAGIVAGRRASSTETAEWRDVVNALHWTSLCGHGTGLGAFAESVLRYYGEELASCFA
ncbi:MAG: NADH-ubiquinone oxidoreductase-F iron-sulfur binding region domain-containing protein [Chthoniobacter sp.]|nr:NADH-ubiquinone oxidoreductase-F iron-sulfur binding region domain-containing protein [Chthoniobacter sp.]